MLVWGTVVLHNHSEKQLGISYQKTQPFQEK